jgi:TonB family protein
MITLTRRRMMWIVSAFAVLVSASALGAQGRFLPPQFASGGVPPQPRTSRTLGGGEVFAEVSIALTGAVSDIKMLRETPPYADELRQAILGWRFRPAEEETTSSTGETQRKPVVSKILVAGIFRAPVVKGPTLGSVPKDVAKPSNDVPFPLATQVPPYGSKSRDSGVVLVEVRVGSNGRVSDAKVIRSDPAFDQAALTAARQWTFRPARVAGVATAMPAYLVFSFRPPVAISGRQPD